MARGTKLTTFLMLAVSLACKPKTQDSETKTLDNLANGSKLRQNVCSGSPKNWDKGHLDGLLMNINVSDEKLKTRLGDEIFIAMTALPNTYVDALSTIQAKILVTPKSHDLCSMGGQVADKNKTFITACVMTVPIGGMPEQQDMEGITIVLAPDVGVIRHSLIRTTGQVFAQVLAQRYMAKSLDGKVTFDPGRFIALQSQLAAAFLEDVANSKLFSINNLEPLLGPNADQLARKGIADFESGKSKNPFAGLNTSKEKLAQFLTFVTADAFDSYYCQAEDTSTDAYDPKLAVLAKAGDMTAFKALQNTRLVMRNFFPATYARFETVNKYMGRMAADFAKFKPATAKEQKGASLALTSVKKDEGGLALRDYNASDRAYVDKRMADYKAALASPPSYWESVRHPFESSGARQMRIMNDYVEDRSRAVNYARMDQAAASGTKPSLVSDEGASSTTWAATKGAVQGLGTGAQNIANGTQKAVVDLGTGVAGVASTAYNEGVGVAAEKLYTNGKEMAANKYAATMKAADQIGEAYGKGDIGLVRAGFELTTASASGLPIIGNAADTLSNSVAVLGETSRTGQTLSYDEQSQIAVNQGNVAGSAILEAGTAKGTELLGQGAAQLAQRGLQGGGKLATSMTTYAAGALDDAAQAGRLSGLGEVAANGATRTALSLEQATAQGAFKMTHATMESMAVVVDNTVNLGVLTPAYEAGKHYNEHGEAEHGAEGEHGAAGPGVESHGADPVLSQNVQQEPFRAFDNQQQFGGQEQQQQPQQQQQEQPQQPQGNEATQDIFAE